MKVKYKGYDLIAERNKDKIFCAIVCLSKGKVVHSDWYFNSLKTNNVRNVISMLKRVVDLRDNNWFIAEEFNEWLKTISRRYAVIGGADGPMILKSK